MTHFTKDSETAAFIIFVFECWATVLVKVNGIGHGILVMIRTDPPTRDRVHLPINYWQIDMGVCFVLWARSDVKSCPSRGKNSLSRHFDIPWNYLPLEITLDCFASPSNSAKLHHLTLTKCCFSSSKIRIGSLKNKGTNQKGKNMWSFYMVFSS